MSVETRPLCALALALSFLALSALGQEGTAVITGEVFDVTGARIANARAELHPERSGIGAILNAADAQGVYRFSGLGAGQYTLRLSSPGFL